MSVDKLSATRIKKLGDGKHGDGGGLYFFVRGDSRIWTFRYVNPNTGKQAEISFGAFPELSLADARAKRSDAREAVKAGLDPKTEKATEVMEDRSVAYWVDRWFEHNKTKLKGDGSAGRWMSPVETHILPALGGRDITTITSEDIYSVLAPIWRTKTSAAEKALQRLGIVMRHSRAGLKGAVDTGALVDARELLGDQGHTVKHIPAMPWADVPPFYSTLGETPVELAIRLLILTASRSAPVRFARVEQFEGSMWVVPGINMKFRKSKRRQTAADFHIPLSDEAVRVIDLARPLTRDGHLFCAYKGKPISDAAMAKFLDRAGLPFRPHGFRASFRTWATDRGEDWTLAERALAHIVGDETQRAYDRETALEPRRPLMQRWADYVTGG